MSYHLYQDSQRHWRWRLQASNNRIIADSGEGYLHKQDCLSAVRLVQGSGNAPIYGI